MDAPSNVERSAQLEALSEPVRRDLYRFAAKRADSVSRVEAADAVGISRTLAAYHLDKLVDVGLLTYTYARDEGRAGGPGAGRPAKRYRKSRAEVSISVPPRDYGVLASLLAEAAAADETGVVRAALFDAAEQSGRAAADPNASLVAVLADRGYEPVVADDGDIVMWNCPFHQVAEEHPDLVCGLNHALVRGCLRVRGDDPDRAELAPRPGRCCVVVRAAGSAA